MPKIHERVGADQLNYNTMGMSSPKSKTEAREKIAKLQGDVAHLQAQAAWNKAHYPKTSICHGQVKSQIADKKAQIAKIRAMIPDLPK